VDQLLTAIEANWEGHEAVRQMCLNAPKYGNGIEWVDAIGFEIERFVLEFLHQHPKPHIRPSCCADSDHVPCSDGKGDLGHAQRQKGKRVSFRGDLGFSRYGREGAYGRVELMARARNLSYREKGGDLINLKFNPANVAGEEGTRRLMQIIRTWCDLKHWHVQFNIINKETMLAAQKDPEKYRT